MSYELKMQGVGNGKRSRLYKKTKRASMNWSINLKSQILKHTKKRNINCEIKKICKY